VPAALRSDRPAVVDRLGVQHYASGLAQLVLLEATTPLTIGIQGPWGMGKSSFMGFIDEALVWLAPANSRRVTPLIRRAILALTIRPLTVPWGPFGSLPTETRRRMRQEASSAVLPRLDEAVREASRTLEETTDEATARRLRRGLDRQRRGRERLWRAMRAAAAGDVLSVQFNAWRYEDSTQIWAGLASTITGRLEATLPRWRRLLRPLPMPFAIGEPSLCLGFWYQRSPPLSSAFSVP
jgi:KAP-like P-loop domain-containing protein